MKMGMKKKFCGVFLLLLFLMMPVRQAQAEDIVIVLDPGHGGTESGAHSTWNGVNYYEELLNLKIAAYAKAELEQYAGVKVYMTRTTDTIPAMDRKQRVKFAKSMNATALVSIHLNSTAEKKTTQSGSLAIVPSTTKYATQAWAKQARELGSAIVSQLSASVGLTNRGYYFDDELGIILYGMKAKIPSMIIEHCFINNPKDCTRYLHTELQLKALGTADATAIANYYKLSKTGTVVQKKNGWQTENGKKCYYINDVKVKKKWQPVGGKYYYFDANGYLKTGPFKIGKTMYLTDANGVRQSGLVEYKGRHYYANSKGVLYTKWQKINGKRYYFSPSNGRAYKGLKKIGKEKYYFSPATGAMQTKWVKLSSGKKMYFRRSDGVQIKGKWLKLSKKYYYIGSDGYAYVSTKKRIGKKVYKFNAQGVCTNRK